MTSVAVGEVPLAPSPDVVTTTSPAAAPSPAGPSVSFRATSNEVTATKLDGQPVPLQKIIEKSEAFEKAFEEAGAEQRPTWPSRPPPPRRGPRPTIIRTSGDKETMARPARWGLVSAVVEAYNRHHELVLRPDDLWQAILTQFSFYVNKHAEELRDRFVDFNGKKTLVVVMGGTLFTADYATFAHRMVHENIVTNIKDPSVVEWLLPKFTTTTWTDQVAASVTLMSTLQAYFQYVCMLLCGIPKVTLLGTPEDWKLLRAKIDRLPEYDLLDGRMTAWHRLLAPVLDEFVRSAEGNTNLAFWDNVCSHHGGGSGPSYLSGWVTVFAAFSHKGEWQGDNTYRGMWEADGGDDAKKSPWPFIDFDKLPVGVVSVPVLVDDNGVQYDTQMLAGQFAYEDAGAEGVALQPRTDWCLAYKGKPKAERRAYQHGEVREA